MSLLRAEREMSLDVRAGRIAIHPVVFDGFVLRLENPKEDGNHDNRQVFEQCHCDALIGSCC